MIESIPANDTKCEKTRLERATCIILHVPQWFQRSDFLDWRQGLVPGQWEVPACWNPQQREGEHNDVFLVFDRRIVDDSSGYAPDEPYYWDGSDLTGLPDDIYAAIGTVLAERRLKYGVLWLRSE